MLYFKSRNIYLTLGCETKSHKQWAKDSRCQALGITATLMYDRKRKLRWSDQKILTTPHRDLYQEQVEKTVKRQKPRKHTPEPPPMYCTLTDQEYCQGMLTMAKEFGLL